jgi:hypothetical protein
MDPKRNRPLAATGTSASKNPTATTNRANVGRAQAIYILRLTSPHGADIRRLRWLLKALLRRYSLRCVSLEVEEAQP